MKRLCVGILFALMASPCWAQRTEENAVTSAEDAFGTTVGRESIGIYNEGSVRGFSPGVAGNYRIEGLFFDLQSSLTSRVQAESTIRIGTAAQGYPFPAPTGVVDVTLRNSGDRGILSALASYGPNGSAGVELDAQIPLVAGRLSTALGVSGGDNHFSNGGSSRSLSLGIVPVWRPNAAIEVKGFWGRSQSFNETTQAVYIVDGPVLPPRLVRDRFLGPSWATTNSRNENAGVLARGVWGPWTVRAGGFQSSYRSGIGFANLIQIGAGGSTTRAVVAFPDSGSRSNSGELRVSRRIDQGNLQHLVTISLRARSVVSSFGGSDFIDLGSTVLNTVISPPRPIFQFGQLTQDRVRQLTAGLGYGLQWRNVGELAVGVQRTSYRKRVDDPGAAKTDRVTNVWLPNAQLAVKFGSVLVAYGSFVRGLEGSGSAPNFAANASELLPALRTRQYDAGIKWTPAKGTTLILGYFNVAKPYLALDQQNLYRALGTETHRGLEISLSSSTLVKGLSVVAGAVIGKPRVSGTRTASDTIGSRPVGQEDTTGQINLDYALPFAKGLSLDGGVFYTGSQAASLDNAVTIPRRITVAGGARYQFKLARTPMTLRLYASNITNRYSYYSVGSNAYVPFDRRAISLYLAADF